MRNLLVLTLLATLAACAKKAPELIPAFVSDRGAVASDDFSGTLKLGKSAQNAEAVGAKMTATSCTPLQEGQVFTTDQRWLINGKGRFGGRGHVETKLKPQMKSRSRAITSTCTKRVSPIGLRISAR